MSVSVQLRGRKKKKRKQIRNEILSVLEAVEVTNWIFQAKSRKSGSFIAQSFAVDISDEDMPKHLRRLKDRKDPRSFPRAVDDSQLFIEKRRTTFLAAARSNTSCLSTAHGGKRIASFLFSSF